MEFRLLGQFELRDGDRGHHLGGPVQRILLAHLLLAGQAVHSTDDLTRRLWGTAAGSTSTLQVHVLRLRRLLKATGCGAALETSPGGYRINLGDDTADVTEFHRHIATARDTDDQIRELHALDTALDLWRGTPLTGVTADWPRFPEVRALTEARDEARTRRAELRMILGRSPDLQDLRDLIAEHPEREHTRHLLMWALHRAGRRKEALATYEDAYRYSVGQLGLEPCRQLQELQHLVLTGG
ncbi:AfsR/SARP family transcriptional regulator [Lentzea sp. NPDC006480]|uniref:AfsR/SARP family transcriptional regulator n=1 Tax=Lentzea sp. NPDC006480 TaxID=3157176 RepID=UPI0033B3E37D